ncbi:hypothetical protein EKO23_20230 [Nocardioides guangzhouensis]|uniref:Uncharacterized protein n=1 Tax=Nocardioides guangzhouensis TaxID=2497878 RepID=A0A4Q4Z6G7_9ACTN|nr:hypothetical protein [Nocardioides guangzhouensis]RYP83058.1 hypothetical protein EKO23_20230 [Nocardioides guangzhouensis]
MEDPVPNPPPADPDVHAQVLGTGHAGLLAARGQNRSELAGRVTAQLTMTSAVLVTLALVVQETGYDDRFRWLAAGLGLAALVTGSLTLVRAVHATGDERRLSLALDRLEDALAELDPDGAAHLGSGAPEPPSVARLLGSTWVLLLIVNTLVAGGLVGLLAGPWGTSEAVGTGVLVGLLYLVAAILLGTRGTGTRQSSRPG